jgi:hypothetical protein
MRDPPQRKFIGYHTDISLLLATLSFPVWLVFTELPPDIFNRKTAKTRQSLRVALVR